MNIIYQTYHRFHKNVKCSLDTFQRQYVYIYRKKKNEKCNIRKELRAT